MVTLNLGIDLGSDCLKIAYAYELSGNVCYGKLEKEGFPLGVAMPAVAYYNFADDSWRFGDEVEAGTEHSFITVVKIKSLLSLLMWQKDEEVRKTNVGYYRHENYFPKFFFPVRRKIKTDFTAMVNEKAVFEVPGKTPRDVCQEFFNYAARVTAERISKLSEEKGVEFDKKINITLVHPSHTGSKYIKELSDLVKSAFGEKPSKLISSTKALTMYAYMRDMIKKDDKILIFDMGEEDISVAKAMLLDGDKLSIDGADGHNAPLDIGGNDVDDAIAAYIESGIAQRETMGTPSYGTEGHIAERGLHSKQYLFVKDIKNAKRILSMPLKRNSVFKSGVPIGVCRDVYIQRNLTREEFLKCVGIAGDDGAARKIADYILGELSRPINFDVTKIFVSGGLVETYGLLDYLKGKVKSQNNKMKVCTFDDNNNEADGFNILSYEDSLYAPAVGGAIVALKNYNVQTIVSLSYATWVSTNNSKVIDIFLNKGEVLPNDKIYFFTSFYIHSGGITNDEIYSTFLTKDDVQKGRFADKLLKEQYFFTQNGKERYLRLGNTSDSEYRTRLKETVGLKTVGGEKGAEIRMYYNGRQVVLQSEGKLLLGEGLVVDEEGNAVPMLINIENLELTSYAPIKYTALKKLQEKQKQKGEELLLKKNNAQRLNANDYVGITYFNSGFYEFIPKCLIEPRFENMDGIIAISAFD